MAYIGTSPSNGVRRVHTYTATASQTTFSGASSEGVTLSYADTNYLDVYQNGILLGSADYTATSGTSVVLTQAASASDLVVIVVYDVFSVADTVSKTNGGSFDNGITIDEDGATVLTVDRATSDGSIIDLQKDGTSVGDIGAKSGDIYMATADTGIRAYDAQNAIIPVGTDGASRDAAVNLGIGSIRWQNLYLSGGVYLGGTGSANYLDDYEEGTWTASLYGTSSGSGTNVTHTAHYSKVGNIVKVGGYFQNINLSSMSGSVNIAGLPFTATGNNYTGSIILYGFTFSGYATPYVGPGGTTIDILDSVTGSAWAGVAIPAAAGKYVMFSLTYRAS